MKLHGTIAENNPSPRVIGIGGEPKVGKTRWGLSCLRAMPSWFGTKGIYVEIDPDGAGSALTEDRGLWERVTLEPGKYLKDELMGIIRHDWKSKGYGTVLIDTGSIFAEKLLMQIAQKSLFGNNVDVGGLKQPTQGDYAATDKAIFDLLGAQDEVAKATGLNFITLYHEHEVGPEPGKAGETYGGPKLAGKAMTNKVIGWYNSYVRMARRARKRTDLGKPVEYDRVIYTQTTGHWKVGIRTHMVDNPKPEILVTSDPTQAWKELASLIFTEENLNPTPGKGI